MTQRAARARSEGSSVTVMMRTGTGLLMPQAMPRWLGGVRCGRRHRARAAATAAYGRGPVGQTSNRCLYYAIDGAIEMAATMSWASSLHSERAVSSAELRPCSQPGALHACCAQLHSTPGSGDLLQRPHLPLRCYSLQIRRAAGARVLWLRAPGCPGDRGGRALLTPHHRACRQVPTLCESVFRQQQFS